MVSLYFLHSCDCGLWGYWTYQQKQTRGLKRKINIGNDFSIVYWCAAYITAESSSLFTVEKDRQLSEVVYHLSPVNVVAVRGAETNSAVFEADEGWKFQFDTYFWLFIFWEGNDMQFFLRQESGANCTLQQKALKVMRCEPAALEAYLFESCS